MKLKKTKITQIYKLYYFPNACEIYLAFKPTKSEIKEIAAQYLDADEGFQIEDIYVSKVHIHVK